MNYAGNEILTLLSFWFGLVMTLLILSALLGDNVAARLGQHLLVGAALGYAGVLVVQHVLRPRLIAPLLADPAGRPLDWGVLALGGILLLAGLDRTVRQGGAAPSLSLWRRGLHGLGRLPVALLLAVGISAGVFGLLQGTFMPQFWRAAQQSFDQSATPYQFLLGVLTLLITTGTLLYLYVDPARYLQGQSGPVRRVMQSWLWIGQRALWLAAGLLFARLLASRLSLLISRVDYLAQSLYTSPLWAWLTGVFG